MSDHGTLGGYAKHAAAREPACKLCSAAKTAWESNKHRQQAYGRWNPWTDAEPVRQHVRALMADGMSLQRIAAAADCRLPRLSFLLYGRGDKAPAAKVRPDFAERVLAVTSDPLLVPSCGVSRRIQALMALGYPATHIARELGVGPSRIWDWLSRPQANVQVDTLARIDAAYRRMCMALPPERTPEQRRVASRTRKLAKSRGYAPPLAWDDDIDEPRARPHGSKYVAAGRPEEIADLAALGIGITEASRRLNISRKSLERYCQRNGLRAEYEALAKVERRHDNQHTREAS